MKKVEPDVVSESVTLTSRMFPLRPLITIGTEEVEMLTVGGVVLLRVEVAVSSWPLPLASAQTSHPDRPGS